MDEQILQNEASIRLGAFLTIFSVMALWECIVARRQRSLPRRKRWPHNIGIVLIDTVLARIVAPTGAVGFAMIARSHDLGIFNSISAPSWLAFIVSLLIMDLAIYFQHRLFHGVPFLWRLHRMHHADLDIDVTTGARFHPVEILLSLGIKFVVILLLGAPALAVLIFEITLNATSMFNHSNIGLLRGLDRVLRWIVVTPDMHRVHHSILKHETDSNFGFNFPWWDRLFRTYRAQPEKGHEGMTIGIEEFRNPEDLRLDRLLSQPFRSERRKTVSQ